MGAEVHEHYDPTGMHNPEPMGSFADLNRANWAHFIQDSNGNFVESVSDLDCLIIWMVQRELKNGHRASNACLVYLMDMEVNLMTMKVKYYKDSPHRRKSSAHSDGDGYTLVRDPNNQRCRCHDSIKGYKDQFNIKAAIENGFPKQKGEYGFLWKTSKNNRCQPSIRQIINGLKRYLVNKITAEKEL